MRRILLVLLAMLPTASFAADAVYDAEATDTGIDYTSETATEMFATCGNDYVSALGSTSIGYPITATPGSGTLAFQVIAPGASHPTFTVKMGKDTAIGATTAKKDEIFAVFTAVQGQPKTVNLTLHAKINGNCTAISQPELRKDVKNTPLLVQDMLNESWNQ